MKSNKIKYNKKRNTAFIYEALVREVTACILKENHKRKNIIINLLKKHFHHNSVLAQDLQCYQSLYHNQNLDKTTSDKIIKEAKLQSKLLDSDLLFKTQTALIHDINRQVGPEVYNTYVPNYKDLATIAQIFSSKTSPKKRVILEGEIAASMCANPPRATDEAPVDKVLYETFVNKFNTRYETELLESQQTLLSRYICSFADNALELKIYLNEELARLKRALTAASKLAEFRDDTVMETKRSQLLQVLDQYSNTAIDESVLLTVMKTQALVEEIQNGDHD